MQQLEANMSQLRKWLSAMEHKLGCPITFAEPTQDEIRKQQQQQQVCDVTIDFTVFTKHFKTVPALILPFYFSYHLIYITYNYVVKLLAKLFTDMCRRYRRT